MATISAPKMAAPAPPQKKAPRPPSKAKPPPKKTNGNSSAMATNSATATQASSAELAKNAASSASAAAKIAFKSFGSKVKRDMQSLASGSDSNTNSDTKPATNSTLKTKKRSPHVKSKSGDVLSGLFGGAKHNNNNNNKKEANSTAATTHKKKAQWPPKNSQKKTGSNSNIPRQPPKLANAHQKSKSDLREKNLKPSVLKNAKTKKPRPSPPPPPNPTPSPESPIESAPFRKRSASHDDVDGKKAPPRKLQFNFFSSSSSRSKSKTVVSSSAAAVAAAAAKSDKVEKPKIPPRTTAVAPQRQKQTAAKATAAPPLPTYDANTVKQKLSKPEDYNELSAEKPVDPMELRRKQKMQGVGRLGARAMSKTENRPTSATNMEQKTIATKTAVSSSRPVPPPVPADAIPNKKPKPAMPSVPPPKPKPKSKRGVIAAMPTTTREGWIYTDQGMYGIASTRQRELRDKGLFEGVPVLFDADGQKKTSNIRVCDRMDESTVAQCMDKNCMKTKHSAKFFIRDTLFEFAGDLSANSFAIPTDCSANALSESHEKIVNALLNTNGGVIYVGIDEAWNIKGVPVRDIHLADIRQSMTRTVQSFSPKLSASDLQQFKFETVALLSKNGQLNKQMLVLRITVPGPIYDDKKDRILFATKKGLKFKKNLNYIMKVVM